MTKPTIMWAAIVKTKNSEWIDAGHLWETRRACKVMYLERWNFLTPGVPAQVRFARVEVKEIQP